MVFNIRGGRIFWEDVDTIRLQGKSVNITPPERILWQITTLFVRRTLIKVLQLIKVSGAVLDCDFMMYNQR